VGDILRAEAITSIAHEMILKVINPPNVSGGDGL